MCRMSILAAAVAAAMLGVAISPAMADPITLKFSHFLGPTSFFQQDVAEPWAKELEARTKGAVKVEIFNASSPYGKPTEQASQVKAPARSRPAARIFSANAGSSITRAIAAATAAGS